MLKSIFLLLLSVLLFISIGKAQQDTTHHHQIHLGFKMGLNISGFTGNVGQFDKHSTGYADGPFNNAQKDLFYTGHIGITADCCIGHSISLSTEVLLNGRGAAYNMENPNVVFTDTANNETNATDRYSFDFFYLETPLIVQYHLPTSNSNTSFRLYGGISPGFIISKHTVYDYYTLADNGIDVNHAADEKQLSNSKNFQVSPILGFWAFGKPKDFPFGFLGDLRFEYSYSPVFSNPGIGNANWFTSVWTVNFGFGVRF